MIGRRWVYAALGVFALAFLLLLPRAFLVVDEERYASQAVAFAQGRLTVPGWEILQPPAPTRLISNYPPGTSLLQAPFVWIGGWALAGLASVIALIVATVATMRWLRAAGMTEGFALLVPGFFGAAFFGRLAMSDVPAAALVAATWMLLWNPTTRRGASFAGGFLGGAILLFREPVVLLVAPAIAFALVRGTAVRWAVVTGGAAAIALRLALSQALFGSALHVRASGYGFSLESLGHSVPLFGVLLLAMFPLGGLLPFTYRGPRRASLAGALALYFGLFLLYEYDSVAENGLAKGVILASRFVVPAVPVLAFMAADVWPRWMRAMRIPPGAATALARSAAAAVVVMAAGVHLLARRQEAVPAVIATSLLGHTTAERPVITNSNATLKYLSPAYAPRRLILRYRIPVDSVAAFASRHGGVDIALLDRSDSELFRDESLANEAFLEDVASRCALTAAYDSAPASWARVRVARVTTCR